METLESKLADVNASLAEKECALSKTVEDAEAAATAAAKTKEELEGKVLS